MLRKTFGIYCEDLSDSELFIETGDEYIACWCRYNQSKTVSAFELFTFKETDRSDFESLLKEIQLHSRLLTTTFTKTSCIWTDEKCLCIPEQYFDESSAGTYLQFMFGQNTDTPSYNGRLNGYHLLAVLPNNELSAFRQLLPVETNMHKYYQLLKGQQNREEDRIHVVFYYSWFILSVFKEGKLQLIQKYAYKVAEDALYYLLEICKMFELPLPDITVYVSGMIDTASPLFETLRGYIHQLLIEPVDTSLFAAQGFQEYPLHYFASFCQYEV